MLPDLARTSLTSTERSLPSALHPVPRHHYQSPERSLNSTESSLPSALHSVPRYRYRSRECSPTSPGRPLTSTERSLPSALHPVPRHQLPVARTLSKLYREFSSFRSTPSSPLPLPVARMLPDLARTSPNLYRAFYFLPFYTQCPAVVRMLTNLYRASSSFRSTPSVQPPLLVGRTLPNLYRAFSSFRSTPSSPPPLPVARTLSKLYKEFSSFRSTPSSPPPLPVARILPDLARTFPNLYRAFSSFRSTPQFAATATSCQNAPRPHEDVPLLLQSALLPPAVYHHSSHSPVCSPTFPGRSLTTSESSTPALITLVRIIFFLFIFFACTLIGMRR